MKTEWLNMQTKIKQFNRYGKQACFTLIAVALWNNQALADSSGASLSASVNFTNVTTCTLDVAPDADLTFSANYDRTTHILTADKQGEKNIKVRVSGQGCNLSALKVSTTTNDSFSADSDYALVAAIPGTPNGGWRYIPFMSRARFYAEAAPIADVTTPLAGNITFALDGMSNQITRFAGTPHFPQGKVFQPQDTDVFPGGGAFLAPDYGRYDSNDAAPLLTVKGYTKGTLSIDTTPSTAKSAIIGLGVILSLAPENKTTGAVDYDVLTPESSDVSMNWVVNVSLT